MMKFSASPLFAFPRPQRWVACLAALALALVGEAALALPLADWTARLTALIRVPGVNSEQAAQQVRIQQHLSIRISPGAPAAPAGLVFEMDQEDRETRLEERKMGSCIPVGAIAGVQSGNRNRLVMFLRDSRVVLVSLDKTCQANDFYSGFYTERSPDGQLCVGRDTIHARSGASCTLRQMRALVETPPRR
jgi:hypothetical protein